MGPDACDAERVIAESIRLIGAAIDAQEGIDAYLFGSALTRADPADIDLLIVYPDRHKLHRFLDELERFAGPLPIDVTAMTAGEVADSGFIERSKAVPIHQFRNL